MKLIAINGSPRKEWNTATMLASAVDGAKSQDAETETIHLYDLSYKGCRSCFACKTIDTPFSGRCIMQDDLTPVLKKAEEADALLLGTPIYFWSMTGEMRSFLERLLFAPVVYSSPPRSLFPRKIKTAVIYTMNAPEAMSVQRGFETIQKTTEMSLTMVFGNSETLCSYDTYQFPDYSKVVMEYFDPLKKAERRSEVFPDDCKKAFDLGCRLVQQV